MRVVVGRIGRPHGVKGQIAVEPRTDEPESRFADGVSLLVGDDVDGPVRPIVIDRVQWHSGRLLLSFVGVDDRTAVEALRGKLLVIDRADDATPDDPEEFYDSSLTGCRVCDQAGAELGTVADIAHLPGQDLLVVHTDAGRELLIPFVQAIVTDIDIEAKRIVVNPPAGLLDDTDTADIDSPDAGE